MSILPNFVRSLLLTIVFTFVAPLLLVGGALTFILLIGYIPGWQGISQEIVLSILQFLASFGSGNSFTGTVVIALTFSLVGALFDTYAFYRYQMLRGD
jgi:hypothetical protein